MKYSFKNTKIVSAKSIDSCMCPPTIQITFELSDPDKKELIKLNKMIKQNPLDWYWNLHFDYTNNKVLIDANRVK